MGVSGRLGGQKEFSVDWVIIQLVMDWVASSVGCGLGGQFSWVWTGWPVQLGVDWVASSAGCGLGGQFSCF